MYTKTVITLADNKKVTIEAEYASTINIYIQSCTIDGVVWNKTWFKHSDIQNGATIHFVMGPKPSDWGKSDNSLQYSNTGTGINSPTGITQNIIYPNPSSDLVTINLQKYNYHQMRVVDIAGRLILSKNIPDNSNTMQLSVKDWNKGSYIVSLQYDKGVSTAKLIVN